MLLLDEVINTLKVFEVCEIEGILFKARELKTIKKIKDLEKKYKSKVSKMALEKVVKKGKKLGRPLGAKNKNSFMTRKDEFIRLANEDKTMEEIAKIMGCSIGTVRNVLS